MNGELKVSQLLYIYKYASPNLHTNSIEAICRKINRLKGNRKEQINKIIKRNELTPKFNMADEGMGFFVQTLNIQLYSN